MGLHTAFLAKQVRHAAVLAAVSWRFGWGFLWARRTVCDAHVAATFKPNELLQVFILQRDPC
jgi:hypothetical protein